MILRPSPSTTPSHPAPSPLPGGRRGGCCSAQCHPPGIPQCAQHQGTSQGSTAGRGEAGSCPAPGAGEGGGGGQDSSAPGCSLSKRRGPRRAWPPASTEEAGARPQIRSRIFPFNDLLYGLVFFGFVFFPGFLGTGRGKCLYCSWLGWGAAGVHQMPVGMEVVPGLGRGGDTASAFVCMSEGTAVPGARGRGHREGGCHGGGGTEHPSPSQQAGRSGRRCTELL